MESTVRAAPIRVLFLWNRVDGSQAKGLDVIVAADWDMVITLCDRPELLDRLVLEERLRAIAVQTSLRGIK